MNFVSVVPCDYECTRKEVSLNILVIIIIIAVEHCGYFAFNSRSGKLPIQYAHLCSRYWSFLQHSTYFEKQFMFSWKVNNTTLSCLSC